MARSHLLLAPVLGIVLLASGCGDGDPPASENVVQVPKTGEPGFCDYFRAAVLNTPGTNKDEHPECYREIEGEPVTATPTP